MPRKLRVQYPGAIYHVMNRGHRREPLFHDDVARRRFVETLGEACGKRPGRCTPTSSCPTLFTWWWSLPPGGPGRLVLRGGGVQSGVARSGVSAGGQGALREELRESAEGQAGRLVAVAMARKGWTEEDLVGRRKGDAFKVRVARELREKTTVTLAWIATCLHMGTRGHLI